MLKSGAITTVCLLVLAGYYASERITAAEASDHGARTIRDWCRTDFGADEGSERYYSQSDLCPVHGDCDISGVRDAWFYDSEDSTIWIRAMIHVFCNGDGSICWSDSDEVAEQIVTLNRGYAQAGIQFACQWHFVYSDEFYSLASDEVTDMKQQYAVAPDSQVNIYVVYFEPGGSEGVLPWRNSALTEMGGIIMDSWQFGGAKEALVHEMGHCLGLWHTHHGVSEVPPCSNCYERPDCSGLDCDMTGDFCSDTPPTPLNYECGPPGGYDPCSGFPWGPTQPENYMSYSGTACAYLFTPQQSARMRCWINDALITWTTTDADGDGIANQDDNCPATFNPAQDDADSDYVGDACDNCIDSINPMQEDADTDGIGDSCDLCTDIDGDGYGDLASAIDTCEVDNCPGVYNPDQEDTDNDSVGDSCDNCIYTYNPDQADSDGDGIGDACAWICGDADGSGAIDIDDVVFLISYIFSGGPEPDRYESGDVDCTGAIDIDDVVYLIAYIFSGGPEPCARLKQ